MADSEPAVPVTARWRIRLRAAIGRWSPMYLLFAAERDTVAELRAELAALTAHYDLAIDQRDRARAIVAADTEAPLWSLEDEAIVGAWLDGERPA